MDYHPNRLFLIPVKASTEHKNLGFSNKDNACIHPTGINTHTDLRENGNKKTTKLKLKQTYFH